MVGGLEPTPHALPCPASLSQGSLTVKKQCGSHPGPGHGVPFPNRRGRQRRGGGGGLATRSAPQAAFMLGSASQDTWQASSAALAPGSSAGGWLGGHRQALRAMRQQPSGKDAPVQQDVLAHLTAKSLSPAGFPFSAARRLGAWERREGRGQICPAGRQSGRHLTPESKYPRFHTFLSSCANTGGYVEHRPRTAEQPQGVHLPRRSPRFPQPRSPGVSGHRERGARRRRLPARGPRPGPGPTGTNFSALSSPIQPTVKKVNTLKPWFPITQISKMKRENTFSFQRPHVSNV